MPCALRAATPQPPITSEWYRFSSGGELNSSSNAVSPRKTEAQFRRATLPVPAPSTHPRTGTCQRTRTAVGDELELTIADIAFGGDGVGRTSDGLSVFVPFTAVGEKVRVRITQRKKRFARGEIVDLLKNSPERRKPSCMHFGTCGGCDYQHLSYEAEITAKSAQLTALIARIGHVSAEFAIAPIVPSPPAAWLPEQARAPAV